MRHYDFIMFKIFRSSADHVILCLLLTDNVYATKSPNRALKTDPYHFPTLLVHIGCLYELGKKNDLFILGHKVLYVYNVYIVSKGGWG